MDPMKAMAFQSEHQRQDKKKDKKAKVSSKTKRKSSEEMPKAASSGLYQTAALQFVQVPTPPPPAPPPKDMHSW